MRVVRVVELSQPIVSATVGFLRSSVTLETGRKHEKAVIRWKEYLSRLFPQLQDNRFHMESMPRQRLIVSSWIRHMREVEQLSMSRINGYLAGVRFCFLCRFESIDIWTDPVITAARKAATRSWGQERKRKDCIALKYPLPLDFLINARADFMCGDMISRMTYVSCCLAYHIMMRVSEFASTGPKAVPHFIRVEDVEFLLKHEVNYTPSVEAAHHRGGICEGVVIHLRSAKNDQVSQGHTHALQANAGSPDLEIQLVLDLWQWAQVSGARTGDPFFCRWCDGRRRVLMSKDIATMVKAIASRNGENPARFSTRSLRSGGATTLTSKGVDVDTTDRLGRWAYGSKSSGEYSGKRGIYGGALSSNDPSAAIDLGVRPFSQRDLRHMQV